MFWAFYLDTMTVVTPVTSAVADGQEYWLVFSGCPSKGFRSPGVPVDGVVGVLEEVGGFFVN